MKPGDAVHAGQTLGRVGNSGSSSEPHLHLQVCDLPSFLASNGMPYEIDSFNLIDYRIDKRHSAPVKLTIHGSSHVSNATPMEDELISFQQPR